jgi:hypothetical protein
MAAEFWSALIDKGVIPLLTVAVSVGASVMIGYYTSHQTRAVAED